MTGGKGVAAGAGESGITGGTGVAGGLSFVDKPGVPEKRTGTSPGAGTGTSSAEMRVAYANALLSLAREDSRIVVLEADLARATGTGGFQKEFPERFINVGVAEANMLGVAAGLATEGWIPFAATFGCFASRRAFDQFFLSCAYAGLGVKLVGTDPGVTAAFNGGTHMPFEDIAIMRTVPGLTILEPSDPVSCAALTIWAARMPGCVYLRLPRKSAPVLYPEDEVFTPGTAKTLVEGEDLVYVALGSLMVNEALAACDLLARRGIKAGVIDALSVKPLDTDRIVAAAKACGRVITAENAQRSGGFGGAVAEALMDAGYNGKFARIGVDDRFGEVGTQDYLVERFGLGRKHLVTKALELAGMEEEGSP